MDHTVRIKNRLDRIVGDKVTCKMMLDDYAYVFHALGLSQTDAKMVAEKCVSIVRESKTLQDAENKIRELFRNTKKGEDDLFTLISRGLDHRVNKIIQQITPYLKNTTGKVFDYGMGAGDITQILHDKLGLDIEGGDVRDFRSKHVNVPFVKLGSILDNEGKIVPVSDKYYTTAVLTNVIHHEEVNENILKELNRIVSHKLVVIETVPVGKTPEEIRLDHERTFAGDVLWNRFLNYADIPVPGTYETPEDWIKRFEKYGWKTIHSEDLGFDQKTIHDVHHLLVFER